MRILTNYIPGARGGINRRVWELEQFLNSERNYSGHEAIAIGPSAKPSQENRGRLRTIALPARYWASAHPGSDEGVPESIASVDAFLEHIEPTVQAVAKIIANDGVDVCLAQAAFYSSWVVIAASKRAGIPVAQLYSGSSQTEVPPGDVRAAYRRIECAFARWADQTWFNSRFAKSTVAEVLGLLFHDAPVFYNGVSSSLGNVAPWQSESVVLGWIGRNVWVKNLECLCRLRELVPLTVQMHAMTDNFHGTNPMGRAGMTFHKPVPPGQIESFYAKISCILSTSHYDFFPNVIAEAIAAGRVPLIPKENGLAEILQDAGLDELIVDLADLPGVRDIVLGSGAFHDAVNKLGAWLHAEHSWPSVIERYFEQMSQLV